MLVCFFTYGVTGNLRTPIFEEDAGTTPLLPHTAPVLTELKKPVEAAEVLARGNAEVRGSSHVGRPLGEWARCSWAGACSKVVRADPANPSIERTVNSRLRRLSPAAHVER